MYVFIWPWLESGPPGEPGDTDHDHQVSTQTIVAVPGVAINKIRHLNNSRTRPDPQTRRSNDTVRSSAAITTLQLSARVARLFTEAKPARPRRPPYAAPCKHMNETIIANGLTPECRREERRDAAAERRQCRSRRRLTRNIQRNVSIGRTICNHDHRKQKSERNEKSRRRRLGVSVTADSRHMTVFYLDEAHPRGYSPPRRSTRFMRKVRVIAVT
ncbi:hypothetical protein SFRURICE_020875 [Spodoptera frugiperda]|nr:hypothetical protein SFRURICE_020875 [Spodoptera frugiperda]